MGFHLTALKLALISLPIVTLKSVATHQRLVSENVTRCIFINDVLKGIKAAYSVTMNIFRKILFSF